jgi:hypothetical protein
LKNIEFLKIAKVFGKSLVAGAFMLLVVSISYKYVNAFMPKDSTALLAIKMIIVAIVGAVCYAVSLVILKVEKLEFILSFKAVKKRH